MQRFRHHVVLLAVLACAAAAAVFATSRHQAERAVAASLRRQIDAGDESQAARLVERMSELGDASLPHLVELLDDDRPAVRSAAREVIRGKVAQWSAAGSTDSDRQAALLAQSLASAVTPRDVHSRVFVKLTALKLLRWNMTSETVDQVAFLACCSEVLEETINARVPEGESIDSPDAADETNNWAVPEAFASSADLPFEPAHESSAAVKEVAPLVDEPQLLPRGEEHAIPPTRFQPNAPRRIRSSEKIAPQGHEQSAIDEKAVRSLSTRSLMRHLHGLSEIAAAADVELRRRGFGDASLVVARAVDDPNPQVRLRLVESISALEGIDPAPWLWELAEDHDERVRKAALAVLATSNNPQTRQKVAQRSSQQ